MGVRMSKKREERVLVPWPDGEPFFITVPTGYDSLIRIPTWDGPPFYVEDHGRRDPKSGCSIFEREDALTSVMREKFGT